ncbi:sugar transferase [Sphingomonas sp.]|uniref:sugar transferase n=1 Tax=Sphingomonas sp. TaxID=28214 RepID=UPI0035C80DE8
MIPPGYRPRRVDPWHGVALQLGGALLLAIIIPFTAAVTFFDVLSGESLFANTLVASAGALIAGHQIFRNLGNFPGIRSSYYVFPIFASTFGVAVMVLFMTRAGYSRPLLLVSFLVTLIWHYVVYFKLQRRQQFFIAVVPMGRAARLFDVPGVNWTALDAPALPPGYHSVAADFHVDMGAAWEEFLAECALSGVPVLHYKDLIHSLTGRVEMEHLSENANGSLVPDPTYLRFKILADAAAAAVALVLLLPLLVVIAGLIKATSRGPVFFVQPRVGYRGRPFRMWKFRTMVNRPATQAELEAAKTLDGDPRITAPGRFLRRSRLDELPQLWNVLRGQMSWIGPRPEAIPLSRWYQNEIPFYRYRHIVRPGITGWAQVSQGHVLEIEDVMKKLSYDFFYISNFSPWIDLLIVVRTIKTMLTGFGSR